MTSDATPSYVPSCGCGRCAFDDCLAKRAQAKVPLWTHPGTVGGLSFIKEVSAGLPVPGMRSAAGAMVSIVEQIATMQDCKLDYATLMRDCLDYITTISLAIEDAQNKAKLDKTLVQGFDQYSRNLEEILQAVERTIKGYLARGWFSRFVKAKADRDDLTRLRQKVSHELTKYMAWLQTSSYIQVVGLTQHAAAQQSKAAPSPSSPKSSKRPNPAAVLGMFTRNGESYADYQRKNYYENLNNVSVVNQANDNHTNVNNHLTAPVTNYGHNSPMNFHNSFQTNNHNVINSNNTASHSTNTYNY